MKSLIFQQIQHLMVQGGCLDSDRLLILLLQFSSSSLSIHTSKPSKSSVSRPKAAVVQWVCSVTLERSKVSKAGFASLPFIHVGPTSYCGVASLFSSSPSPSTYRSSFSLLSSFTFPTYPVLQFRRPECPCCVAFFFLSFQIPAGG